MLDSLNRKVLLSNAALSEHYGKNASAIIPVVSILAVSADVDGYVKRNGALDFEMYWARILEEKIDCKVGWLFHAYLKLVYTLQINFFISFHLINNCRPCHEEGSNAA